MRIWIHAHSSACLVLGKVNNFSVTFAYIHLEVTDPNRSSTSSTQQVVPVTELRTIIAEVVKEVLTDLRAGNKSNDEETPSNTKGR